MNWMKKQMKESQPYVDVYHPEWTSSESLAEAVVRFDLDRYEKTDALRRNPSWREREREMRRTRTDNPRVAVSLLS